MTALQDRATNLAQSIRSLSHELHPSVLHHAGLVAALKRHCDDVAKNHTIDVAFRADGNFDALAPDTALCLFRVAQEALHNAVRHGRPRAVHVTFTAVDDGVELMVADDGVGFVTADRLGSGLGLRSIDERVRLLRGQATVESRPGQGTSILVRLPIC